MKRALTAALLLLYTTAATAHTDRNTAGIALHHLPLWLWAGIGLLLATIAYLLYVQTHDRPLNPFDW
ncbi:MAG: hypothetical protein SV186_02135 [Candidatus Nanohaloarchaea archaeon]|nr:hypothetical protein [Candidatus Nanohaloarchaea archaeon]